MNNVTAVTVMHVFWTCVFPFLWGVPREDLWVHASMELYQIVSSGAPRWLFEFTSPAAQNYVLVNLISFSGLVLTMFQLLLCESVAGVGVQHFGDDAAGMPVLY